jgi:predicted Zn-dependent protease
MTWQNASSRNLQPAPSRRATRWSLLIAALSASLAGGCAVNPVTGERELALISESQEIQMGQEGAQQVIQSLGLVEDPALQSYVDGIGQRLAASSERPNLPWSFGVVEDPTPNAFALPGGPIFLTRGMLTLMDSEAELASVLGHEIGHITARHSVNQMSKAQLAQLSLGLGSVFVPELGGIGGQVAGASLQLLFLKYGRDDERQSDELGFRYALDAGYDVREMDDVFASLQRIGEQQGSSPVPSWASTHPAPGERIENIGAMIAAVDQPLENLNTGHGAYLRRVDGLVYGENPRNGFFRDNLFLHPDLAFRMEFPQGWQKHNLPRAVVAVSPQQDAQIVLELAQGSPAAALREFLGQQGIRTLSSTSGTTNGNPSATGIFQAATQQGVLAGAIRFIAYGGNTYQLLAITGEGTFSRWEGTFGSVLESFARLTDSAALNVQPNRLTVVELPSAMTLSAFQERYPSVISLEELALINQVESAATRIPAGTLVKRVVGG